MPVIKKIIDYSRSPYVYVNWNCNESDEEGEVLQHNFNIVMDRIRGVHMHELWEDYPYGQLFGLLSGMGYGGYCNAEIPGNPDPLRLLRYYRSLFLALQQ